TAEAGSDLLDPAAWKKSPIPVFWQSPKAGAYGPGHSSFFRSPDGTEDWFLYHANTEPSRGRGNRRSPRAQRFTWKTDGTPDFGRPIAVGVPAARPSGDGRAPELRRAEVRPFRIREPQEFSGDAGGGRTVQIDELEVAADAQARYG